MTAKGRIAWYGVSIAGLIAIWAVVAAVVASDVLPGPSTVLQALQVQISDEDYFWHLGATLARVAVAFFLAMVIGSAIGLALGTHDTFDRIFGGWVIVLLNIPALVVIVLCFVWFGLTEAAAIGAVAVNKIPNVAATLKEGAKALSRDLAEVAQVYRLSWWARLRHVILPQLAPFFAAAARNGLALVWKIVLVVELLGRPNGVGFQIHTYFQLFDVATILAYTIGFIVVVFAVEILILEPWESRAKRWRR